MKLDNTEVQAAYYAVCGFVRQRAIAGRTVPREVQQIAQRLDTHVRLSSTRHESGCGAIDKASSEVWIGASQAAAMTGRGLRFVQRHAAQIGGQLIGGRWVFAESDVIDFIERQPTDG